MKIFLYLFVLAGICLCTAKAEENVLNGRILEVNSKFDFVIINLGEEDGVERGMIFMVYRDKKLLGKVQAEDVFPKMSSCVILPEWKQATIRIDDGVIAE